MIDAWAPLEAEALRAAVAPAKVLAYAHRLSYSTFAPPGFIPGQTPLRHFKPPAPQELQLRSSLLHEHHRESRWLGRGQGAGGQRQPRGRAALRAAADSPRPSCVHAAGTWEAAQQAAKQQPLHRPLQQPPPAVKAEAPPARPPQPAAAPVVSAPLDISKLPPMPAGWKPGDPIPGLGPLPTLPAEEAPAAPAAAAEAEEEEEEVEAKLAPAPAALPPVSRPLSVAFDFSLNPDLMPVFDASSEEESSDSE